MSADEGSGADAGPDAKRAAGQGLHLDPASAERAAGLVRGWGNVPARDPVFAGREEQLAAARAGLLAGGPVVVHAVRGMGGAGNSQVATTPSPGGWTARTRCCLASSTPSSRSTSARSPAMPRRRRCAARLLAHSGSTRAGFRRQPGTGQGPPRYQALGREPGPRPAGAPGDGLARRAPPASHGLVASLAGTAPGRTGLNASVASAVGC